MKICLDAGHGGHDSGACHANGRQEKDDVLNYAVNALGSVFTKNGIEVVYTRTADEFVTLQNRCNISNNNHVDLFISCHRDGYNGEVHGAHTCVYEDSGTQHAIASNLATVYAKYGFKLRFNGISERPELWVLNGTKSNAILLEVGFVDNTGDNDIFDSSFNNLFIDMAKAIVSPYGLGINGDIVPVAPIAPTPAHTTPSSNATVDSLYQVRTQKHGWLPPIRNAEDYAGYEESPITDIAVRANVGTVKYRVHILGGGWLAPVTGCDTNNANNGYAGIGEPIDAVEIYYFTPDSIRPFKSAKYRVAKTGGDYYSWQIDSNKNSEMDGYAGAFGNSIGKLQLCIE